MKKILLFLMLISVTTISAQTIVRGDMNDDNNLSVVDVTRIVNVILGKTPMEYINLSGYAYMVDNSMVVGTWYAPDGTSFTLNADGTTNYTGAATYKFRPYQGTLIFYDGSEKAVKTIAVNEIGSDYLLSVNFVTGSNFYYTSVKQEVNPDLYVDFGLPSGTLWATCNIGARSPEDYGDYFAWGETTGYNGGKFYFGWGNYQWCMGTNKTITKYCNNNKYGNDGFTDSKIEIDLEDDAAYANWGPNWQMPSQEQFNELINSSYTTTTWTTINGVSGRKITSKTDTNKSIFLPAAADRDGNSVGTINSYGDYWTRTIGDNYPFYGTHLNFTSSTIRTSSGDRYRGNSIRPVIRRSEESRGLR